MASAMPPLDTELRSLVAALTPGRAAGALTRTTRLETDLGWDKWYKLKLREPIKARFKIEPHTNELLECKTVGDVIDLVARLLPPAQA